jgi:hypothetical protein
MLILRWGGWAKAEPKTQKLMPVGEKDERYKILQLQGQILQELRKKKCGYV